MYQGELTVELTNNGPQPMAIYVEECIGLLVPIGEKIMRREGDQHFAYPSSSSRQLALSLLSHRNGRSQRVPEYYDDVPVVSAMEAVIIDKPKIRKWKSQRRL